MKRLLGKRGDHQYDPQTVFYLTGHVNYSYLHLVSGEVIMSCRTLKWFEDKWPHFLRIHKKILVNPVYISSCKLAHNSTGTNYLTVASAAEFEIARRRVPVVIQALRELGLARSPKEGKA